MLKLGIMGCAAIARRRVIPALLACGEFELVALASRTEERAKALTNEFGGEAVVGYEALLKRGDLDCVYMPLPTGLHEEWVERTLEAGLHVLVEKSFTDQRQVAERLTALARERGLVLMENLMFLYHPVHARVQALVRDGALGEIRALRSSFGFPPLDRKDFRYDRALGGGALIDAGTYTVRAARLYLESPEVCLGGGSGLRVLGASLCYEGPDGVDLFGGALLESSRGVTAQVAFGFDHDYRCSIEIWGSNGRLFLDRAFTPPPDFCPRISVHRAGQVEHIDCEPADHYANLLLEFARSVRAGDAAKHGPDLVEQARLLESVRALGEPS